MLPQINHSSSRTVTVLPAGHSSSRTVTALQELSQFSQPVTVLQELSQLSLPIKEQQQRCHSAVIAFQTQPLLAKLSFSYPSSAFALQARLCSLSYQALANLALLELSLALKLYSIS